jgi:hypothetical protein
MNLFYDLDSRIYFIDNEDIGYKSRLSISTSKGLDVSLKKRDI